MILPNDLLAQLVDQYQLQQPQVEHLGSAWNATYRIEEAKGATYSLRLCHPYFQDLQSMQAELAFVAFVAERQQVRVPQPVLNRNQAYVTPLLTPQGTQWCGLFRWIDGIEARGRLTAPLVRQVGRNMAHLHQAAHAYPFPTAGDGFREGYCYDEVLVQYHHSWIDERAALIGEAQVALLRDAVNYLLEVLATCEKRRDTYGIIHADLYPRNFIVNGDQVAVIDFDQVGRGYFCYDIAVFMVGLSAEPAPFADLWASFQAGYQEVAPLPYAHDALLEPFAIAVDLVFLDAYYNSWTPEGRAQYGHQLPAVYTSIRKRLASV